MNKHYEFRDRVILEYYINTNPRGSAIEAAELLGKAVSAVYYELKNNVTKFSPKSVTYNKSDNEVFCRYLLRFPFCCNNCAKTLCSHRCRKYSAYEVQRKAERLLVNSRVNTEHRKATIEVLDNTLSQLIKDGLSIKVAMMSVNRCDVSESTVRRYINKGLLRARRIDLPNSVRFKAKRQYDYSKKKVNIEILYKRTYQDYLDYMEANPSAKVIQVDSVIGKSSDKYALLTVFFMNSKFQLAVKYNRKHSNVNEILERLYDSAFEQGYKLFDVILTDNGTEFMKLPKLEKLDNEEIRCQVFYCDPYRSCQKAECERNHGLIRRIFRKGKSLDSASQNDFDMALSHINSYPRGSLNNQIPFDLFTQEYDSIIASIFNIDKVEISQLCLRPKI